jgi:hypothetical protein
MTHTPVVDSLRVAASFLAGGSACGLAKPDLQPLFERAGS